MEMEKVENHISVRILFKSKGYVVSDQQEKCPRYLSRNIGRDGGVAKWIRQEVKIKSK